MLLSWPALGVIRGRFLLLALSCVALGVAVSLPTSGATPTFWMDAALVLLGALAAHGAVNALNEYADYRSGLDLRTARTPFSGGSGTLVEHPQCLAQALWLGVGGLLLSAAIGLCFLIRQPALVGQLAPLGAAGLLLVVAYTPWLTRRPWLCLLAPGLGFGPLMVLGTQVVLAGEVGMSGVLLSLVPFCLCNNLLLLNQFPDIDADRGIGRLTLPMLLGRPRALTVLGAQWLLAFAGLLGFVLAGWAPTGAALGLLGVLPALRAWRLLRRDTEAAECLLPAMGLNVLVSVATPLLMAVGMVVVR
ncbi:prenyltransferase [Geopseudomonas guangdongensis]|uniref:1,4-dihydroxy-2-naphthoate octaprenyltransferase n=1 Tax=Geopseudomonas guangdongensis TaxID=1245526 RepID=A0A1H2H591_9GAMM|nr:prenyltransferase [Pseudomonas guangdongensis]SDU26972.1 1,4-dihydroxy-2-naphthoate octaprenyltransferase [Pseudomonas guangdongensis]